VQCPEHLTNISGSVPDDDGMHPVLDFSSYGAAMPTPGPSPTPTVAPTNSPPKATTMPPTMAPPSPPSTDDWVRGTWTTGYWDCCKPSCSWPNKGNMNRPVLACDADTGEKLMDANEPSVCNGGGKSASCADNKPFLVRERLSMGFSAIAVSGDHGLTGDANCGQCFELKFADQRHDPNRDNWGGSHPDLVGKSMVVQVTNIGYDVNGDHSFDLQIPGAGQGLFTDGCTRQFSGYSSGDFDCDKNYGGCDDRSGCQRLPPSLRSGCEWRYDWYRWLIEGGQTNNPWVDFRRVQCPEHLTNISGSVPDDDGMHPMLDFSSYGDAMSG